MKFGKVFYIIFCLLFLSACSQSVAYQDEEAEKYQFEDGRYQVLLDKSTLYWEGFKMVGSHIGGISLLNGEVWVEDGQLDYGSFKIDMNSIRSTDLQGHDALMLVNQLKSDDFFASARYPFSRFDVTRIRPYQGFEDYNYEIEGDLDLKDESAPVTVLAKVTQNEDRLTIHGKAHVDRTQFGIHFRSPTFFAEIGDQLIEDEFVLEMDLVAQKKSE